MDRHHRRSRVLLQVKRTHPRNSILHFTLLPFFEKRFCKQTQKSSVDWMDGAGTRLKYYVNVEQLIAPINYLLFKIDANFSPLFKQRKFNQSNDPEWFIITNL